ncbi:MAG: hypothetical protein JJT94_01865 [Bernardetiaceae bacterium]|nr:hypothetical protein [Bernardetiaceae bacterium]
MLQTKKYLIFIALLIIVLGTYSCRSSNALSSRTTYEVKVYAFDDDLRTLKMRAIHVETKSGNIISFPNVENIIFVFQMDNVQRVCIEPSSTSYYPNCFKADELLNGSLDNYLMLTTVHTNGISLKNNSFDFERSVEEETLKNYVDFLIKEDYFIAHIYYSLINEDLNYKRAKWIRKKMIEMGLPKKRVKASKKYGMKSYGNPPPPYTNDFFPIHSIIDTSYCTPCDWSRWRE